MKILLLYTPRSGSTSISRYFSELKPDYECYDEPWFEWMINNFYNNERISYEDIIKKENVFVKSAYRTMPVPIEQVINDFDKIIVLLRKNIVEQVESSIITHLEGSFLNYTKRVYNTYNITEDEYESFTERYSFLNETLVNFSQNNNIPLFYYENLYYDSFDPLFKELDIEYNETLFKKYLDISNRYRITNNTEKEKITLI